MDQANYERWWQLHLRTAKGEILNDTEQTEYEAGTSALDLEEQTRGQDADLALLRKLKAEIARLEAAHAQLQTKNRRLEQQIWTLEGAYAVLTGLELGGQSYVTSPV